MITLLRSGIISASIAMARMPPLQPTYAAGLPRKAKVVKTLSTAFFSTAGMLLLYSRVMNR